MRLKRKEQEFSGPIGTSNYLGSDALFEGQLDIEGNIRIDGKMKGCIRCMGLLVVGPEGFVEGPVQCHSLRLEGRLSGQVQATGLVSLMAGGRLHGDITAVQLEVHQGAYFCGKSVVPDDVQDVVWNDDESGV